MFKILTFVNFVSVCFSLSTLALSNSAFSANIVKGSDTYTFEYEFTVPSFNDGFKTDVWIPVARSNRFQTVKRTITSDDIRFEIKPDKSKMNEILHFVATKTHIGRSIKIQYEVTRKEVGKYPIAKNENLKQYLKPDSLVPTSERFQKIADEVTSPHKNDMDRAKAIYDYVLKEMKYDKSNPDHGRGDAIYACDSKSGNCTDFHALFIAIARAAKIPARFAIGFTIPANNHIGKVDGYHCWAEFAAGGHWVPIDISEAAKDPENKDYFFGHHPANRLQISQGRDIEPQPLPASGAINFLVHPFVEQAKTVMKGTKGFYFFERKSKRVYEVEKSMLKTTADGSGDGYTAVSNPFEPASKLRALIETKESIKLQHRGEAHITAITPPEFKTLNTKLSVQQIREGLPLKSKNQFTIKCLGHGEKSIDGKAQRTFFIVVDHPGLVSYRKDLQNKFEALGGEKGTFIADKFYPHITIGFLEKDLHLQDGVVKDRSSCFAGLSLR